MNTKPTEPKILDSTEDSKTPIGVRISDRFGRPGLDVRQYWYPEEGKPPSPTKKGVRIPFESVPEFIRLVLEVAYDLSADDISSISDACEMANWTERVRQLREIANS